MSASQANSSQPTSATPKHSRGNSSKFKKEGPDWVATFNLNTPSSAFQPTRTLDVDLVRSLGHKSIVCSVRFSHDGVYLATGCNRTTHVYEVATGVMVWIFVDDSLPRSEDHYIRDVCFSPDGRYVATGSDGNVRVWSMYTRALHKRLPGHTDQVYSLDYSPDGRFLVSGSGDGTVRVWNLEELKNDVPIQEGQHVFVINPPDVIPEGEGVFTAIAISPNSKFVAAASLSDFICIWDVDSQSLVAVLEGHTNGIYDIAFGRDGMELISGGLDRTVKRWDVTPIYHPKEQPEKPCVCKYTYSGHKDYILSVSLSHDFPYPQWVISSSKDCTIKFWDITQTEGRSKPEFTLKGHSNSVISVDASPVGGLFVTGGGDCCAKIWKYRILR